MRNTRPNDTDKLMITLKATWASITLQQCHKGRYDSLCKLTSQVCAGLEKSAVVLDVVNVHYKSAQNIQHRYIVWPGVKYPFAPVTQKIIYYSISFSENCYYDRKVDDLCCIRCQITKYFPKYFVYLFDSFWTLYDLALPQSHKSPVTPSVSHIGLFFFYYNLFPPGWIWFLYAKTIQQFNTCKQCKSDIYFDLNPNTSDSSEAPGRSDLNSVLVHDWF